MVLAGDTDQQMLAVRRRPDAGRLLAGGDEPAHRLRRQVDGRDLVAFLQRDIRRLAVARESDVARGLGQRDGLGQCEHVVLVAVDIHAVEAVADSDEPLAVGLKPSW